MSLYTDLIDAGIEVDHHESDLYCPVNLRTIALLKKHNLKGEVFKSQTSTTAHYWFDVPFQYDPFWESKGAKA